MTAAKIELTYVISRYWSYLRKADIRPLLILLPLGISVTASIFEGISLGMLVPLIRGVIEGDFSFVNQFPVIGVFLQRYPEVFSLGNKNIVILLVSITFGASVVTICLQYVSSLLSSRLLRTFITSMRKLIFSRLLLFGKSYYDQNSQGYLQQVILGYVHNVCGVLSVFQSTFFSFTTLLVYMAIMFTISWKLTLVVFAIFPVLYFLLNSIVLKIRETSLDLSQAINSLAISMSNFLTVVPLVRAYGTEEFEEKRFADASDKVEAFQFSVDKKSMLVSPLQQIISLFFLLLLITIIGFFIAGDKNWNVAGYAVFIIVLRRASTQFGFFNYFRTALAGASGPFREIDKIFNDEEKGYVVNGTRKFTGMDHQLEFKELVFSYPAGRRALDGVSFHLIVMRSLESA